MAINSISARKNQFSIEILAKSAPCYLALNSYKIEENFMDGPRLVEMGGCYMAVLNIKWELDAEGERWDDKYLFSIKDKIYSSRTL